MRIIAADSSSAILNSKFEPIYIVATAAVAVDPPYREPTFSIAEPIFADAKNGREVIIREAELCKELLGKVKADVVHLDMSLGAVSLEQLSPIQFSDIKISNKARRNLLKIFPRIRRVAGEITQKYGVDVLAIGKESIPVRIAELTSGAHAILYVCEKALKEDKEFLLGLPSKCQHRIAGGRIYLYSLMLAEHDVRGYAEDGKEVLKKVNITEMLNPVARGFRIIKIAKKD
ncbi:MAG: DUF4152 family protein [Candidatus Bathyarchaeia archaeon]